MPDDKRGNSPYDPCDAQCDRVDVLVRISRILRTSASVSFVGGGPFTINGEPCARTRR